MVAERHMKSGTADFEIADRRERMRLVPTAGSQLRISVAANLLPDPPQGRQNLCKEQASATNYANKEQSRPSIATKPPAIIGRELLFLFSAGVGAVVGYLIGRTCRSLSSRNTEVDEHPG